MDVSSPPTESGLIHGIIWSVGLNTVIPVIFYELSKHFLSSSEYTALLFATAFPLLESMWGLIRERSMDPIALLVLLGIAVDAGALALGGSPRILLLRESIFTGAFGVACFVSMVLPRPLMFYFGRYFMAGSDPVKLRRYNDSWRLPEVRHGNRLVTLVWGAVFTGELALRITLVYELPPAAVLVISPLVLGVLTVATIIWSLAYARRMRAAVLPRLIAPEVSKPA